METCDCDRTVIHDCVCPECKDRYNREQNRISDRKISSNFTIDPKLPVCENCEHVNVELEYTSYVGKRARRHYKYECTLHDFDVRSNNSCDIYKLGVVDV